MEYEILDALDDLRYVEKIDEQGLQHALKDIQKFSQILEWVCNEMKSVSNLEESITRVEKSEDLNAFHMELNSLLKELGCPYEQVMNGSPAERFEGEEKRKIILNFLLAELQASRIDHVKNRKQLKVELSESSTARLLREMLQTLGIPKPPVGIPMPALLSKLNERITDILKKMPPKLKGSAFFVGQLSPKQWEQIDQLNNEFRTEYIIRREMLLKRLDVTVQSFHWSDRLKNKKDDINRIFRQKRDQLDINPSVRTSEILAARSDLAIIEKTSSASVRKNTKSAVNTVVIGKVPDRGGRPNECQPPPPEMPPWQQRQGGGGGQSGQQGWSQGPQTQRNYGEGRGARGASQQRPKVQGGWSDHGQQQQNYSQQQNQSHGSYNKPQYQQSAQYSQPQTHQGSYGGGGGGYQQQQQQQQGGSHYQDRGSHQGRGQGNQGNYERDQGNARGGGGGGYRGGGGGHRGGGGYRGGGGSGRHQY